MSMEMSIYIIRKKDDNDSANELKTTKESGSGSGTNCGRDDFHKLLEANLLGSHAPRGKGHRVLAFNNKAPEQEEGYKNGLKALNSHSQNKGRVGGSSRRPTRHIPSAPVRILAAPDMVDDYYLNLLSWSSSNVLAVALGQCVYLWDAKSKKSRNCLASKARTTSPR